MLLEKSNEVSTNVQQQGRILMETHDETPSPTLPRVVHNMSSGRRTEVKIICRTDKLLIAFGNWRYKWYLKDGDQDANIRKQLRLVANFLLESRKCNSAIISLEDVMNPELMADIIQAAENLAGWNDSDGSIDKPSKLPKIHHALQKVQAIYYTITMEEKGKSEEEKAAKLKKCEQFLTCLNTRFAPLTRGGLQELRERKWNKPRLIPLVEDLKKLRAYIKCLVALSSKALTNDPSNKEEYKHLSYGTMAGLSLFNRKRQGEPSAITLKHLKFLKLAEVSQEMKKILTKFELEMCQNYKLIHIRGKCGNKVGILVDRFYEDAINLIVKCRSTVGVAEENPFVFAIAGRGSRNAMRTSDALNY